MPGAYVAEVKTLIYENVKIGSRNVPYKERFHLMITFEVSSSMTKIERTETTFSNWLAEMGGIWTFFTLILALAENMDDVTHYVLSDILKPYKSKFLKEQALQASQIGAIDEPPQSNIPLKKVIYRP